MAPTTGPTAHPENFSGETALLRHWQTGIFQLSGHTIVTRALCKYDTIHMLVQGV